MTQISRWGHWRPHFRSGEETERVRAWYRRVPCTSCSAPASKPCRTAGGYPTGDHRARLDAAGDPPYEQWRKQGLFKAPARKGMPPILDGSMTAQRQYGIDRSLGDAVAMVSHVLANRLGMALADPATLDQLDETALDLVLSRGPEGSAEVMTVLASQLAIVVGLLGGPDSDPEEVFAALIHNQASLARQQQNARKSTSE